MSYRYNSLDIVVGVGMCAIMFGALIVFVAASGTFLVTAPESATADQFAAGSSDQAWLQPALGQAMVEQFLLQRKTDQITAAATAEWNRALLAHRSLQATPGGPLAAVLHRAEAIPLEHAARVQSVMGRSIVNGTRRGIRSGVLSADHYLSDFNTGMIGTVEAMGRQMHREFSFQWQAVLGQTIVETSRDYAARKTAIQEQLGSAILQRAQAKTVLQDAWDANQYQMGSVMAAIDRSNIVPAQILAAQATPRTATEVSSYSVSWPDIPLGVLIVAAFGLCTIFFWVLMSAGSYREAKALVEARRNSTKWVYRMAT